MEIHRSFLRSAFFRQMLKLRLIIFVYDIDIRKEYFFFFFFLMVRK